MRLGIDWSVSRQVIPYGSSDVAFDLFERRRQVRSVEDDALEEGAAFGVVGVLIKTHDVRLVARDQAGDRRDQAGLVRAVDDQAGVIAQCFVVYRHGVKSSPLTSR